MRKKILVGVAILLIGFLLGGLTFYTLGKITGQGRFLQSPITPNVPRQIMETGRAFSDIVNAVSPSVVNISTTKVVRKETGPFFDDPFFETKKVVHLPLKYKSK